MIWRKLICKSIWISDLKKSSLKGFKKKNLKMFWTDSWVIWFRKCFKNVLTGGMFMPHQHCDQPWSLKAMDCNLLPQNSHSPPYSYSPLFSNILSYFCYLFSNTLVTYSLVTLFSPSLTNFVLWICPYSTGSKFKNGDWCLCLVVSRRQYKFGWSRAASEASFGG